MHFGRLAIPLLTTLIISATAQDVDFSDLPAQCQSVCAPVVTLTQQCDQQFNDNDADQLNCVCTAANAATILPLCAACYATFDDDGIDNDVNDLVRGCSFTTTTWNPAATAVGVATTPGAVVPGAVGTGIPSAVGTRVPGAIVPTSISTAATAVVVPATRTTPAVGVGTLTYTPVPFTGAAVKGKAVNLAAGLLGIVGALVA